ncbi:MAG: glycosyltransferase, partial [Phycisphaerae bacterium]|nr:glycosyltransferase [Phycisphaerae bacterium]
MPLVTVLLPVYNGERFLAEAIKSVLSQTFCDFELLIVDDGSTDHSAGIIKSFDDPRIRVIQNKVRLKLSGALNRGMDNARGAYIARMDADDICIPGRLAVQVDYMNGHPDVGICGGWVEAFGEHPSSGTIFKYPLTSTEIKASLLFDNPFAHPSLIFRRDFFDRHNLRFDGSFYPAEDYELWIRALDSCQAENIPVVLLKYRLHGNSMTLSGRRD